MIRLSVDTDNLVSLYQSGKTVKEVAEILGIGKTTVCRRLRDAGIKTRGVRLELDVDKILALYNSGKSVKAIAKEIGADRPAVIRRLKEAGITPRGRSDSMYLRMSQTPQEERMRLTDAAHTAVRGSSRSEESLCQGAKTRETMGIWVSRAEVKCAEMLQQRGFICTPQKAVGRYNVDVAIDEPRIAVEIFGGQWHTVKKHTGRYPKRLEYLFNNGWHVVIIWVTRNYPLEVGAIEYLVALAEKISRGEAVWCEEHMIRGDGKLSTIGKDKLHNLPVIHGPQPRDDTTGRFKPRARK